MNSLCASLEDEYCSIKAELHLGTNYGVFLNDVVELSQAVHFCPKAHSHVESCLAG